MNVVKYFKVEDKVPVERPKKEWDEIMMRDRN